MAADHALPVEPACRRRSDARAGFWTPQALVTVRKDENFAIDAVLARWDSAGGLAKNGVGFLLHGLLDYIVDGHFEVVQALDEQVEQLEDLVFDERPHYADMHARRRR
jgi:magnesium transporter